MVILLILRLTVTTDPHSLQTKYQKLHDDTGKMSILPFRTRVVDDPRFGGALVKTPLRSLLSRSDNKTV